MGGGELSLIAILKNLDKQTYKVRVICYEDGHFPDKLRELGFECAILRRGSKLWDWLLILRLVRYIRKDKIDIVHVNSLDIRAGLAARLSGVPLVGHLRVIFPLGWPDFLFAGLSSRIMAVSNAVVEGFCGSYPRFRSKFTVLPNAVEIPYEIKPASLREEFGLPDNAWLVGMAGRIDPYKGHHVFIDAAQVIKKKIPQAVFFIIGEASEDKEGRRYLSELREHIDKLGLRGNFIFSGFRRDIMNVISALDTVVIPSLEQRKKNGVIKEGFGRVVIEAAVCGSPAVASRVGGLEEIIEDGITGILVPADNPEELAEAVVNLFENPEKRARIEKEARRKAEAEYGISSQMTALEGVYCSVLGIERKNDNPCIVCGNAYVRRIEKDNGYNVLQCLGCGFSYVWPMPADELLKERYSQDYYAPWLGKQRKNRMKMWKKRLAIVNRFFDKPGSLLDIGCAEGLFLELAKARGWEVCGTEFSGFAAAYVREKLGIDMFEGEPADVDFGGKKFDAVTMWHVLEHTKNPLEVLKKIKAILNRNGVLILAVPNLNNKISQVIYRIIKGKRPHLFSPDDRELHLVFFSPYSLQKVLEKAGFEVLDVVPDYGCIRWQERLLNMMNKLFCLISGEIVFDAFEAHARPGG